jgi:hypothetical protein
MDRIRKPVGGDYSAPKPISDLGLPKSEVELPKSGAKPIYTYRQSSEDVISPHRAPSSWRGPGPHGDQAPASAAGFYAFGARRYAETDLSVWRSLGPGWAIAWAIASVFAALLFINLLASVAS